MYLGTQLENEMRAESMFEKNNPCFVIEWLCKRLVFLLDRIHSSVELDGNVKIGAGVAFVTTLTARITE